MESTGNFPSNPDGDFRENRDEPSSQSSSIMETVSSRTMREDHPNVGGFSRKHMLLNQYRKEQYSQGDKSVKDEEPCENTNTTEPMNVSESSSNETYLITSTSNDSQNYENNAKSTVTDKSNNMKILMESAISFPQDDGSNSQTTEQITCAPGVRDLQDDISDPALKVKQKKPNPLISDTKKCQVCMAPAAKHVHYGATTCFSCRAFFRRSVQTAQARNYICRRQGNCEISPDNRKSCQKCRLETCLKIGMKPGWVLNEDERARRFKKLKMKKAQQSRANNSPNSSHSTDNENRINDRDNQIRFTLSPSLTTQYSRRRKRHYSSQDNVSREHECASTYGYKPMYLQLRAAEEGMSSNLDRGRTRRFSDIIQLDETRKNSLERHSQMEHPIKLENDHDLSATTNEMPFTTSEDVASLREEGGHSNTSRQQYRDEMMEKSNAFLRNNPAELAAISNGPTSLIYLGRPSIVQHSSPDTRRVINRSDECSRSTFSTFQPISSPTPTTPNSRHLQVSTTPESNPGKILPIYSGFHNNRNNPSSTNFAFHRLGNDFRITDQSSLLECMHNSSDSRPTLPTNCNYDSENIMKIEERVNFNDINGHMPLAESSVASCSSSNNSKRLPLSSRSSPDPEVPSDARLKSTFSLASRLEGMFAGPGEDEINVVNEFVSLHDKHYKSINFGEDLIKEMIMSSIFGIPMSANNAMSAYRLMVQRVTRVAKNFTDFTTLSGNVQGVLLKHNADLVVSLRGAAFFTMKKGLDQILTSLGFDDIETAKKMILTTLKSNNTKEEDYKRIDYRKFNTIQKKADKTDDEARYDLLLSRIGAAVTFNQNLVKILSYVLLFCSDFRDEKLDVKERISIEKTQERMILIVERYVFATYPESMATSVFAGMMECLGNLRELCAIKSKRGTVQVSNKSTSPTTLVH